MRFLCLYKPVKEEGIPPTRQELAEMGKVAGDGESEIRQVFEASDFSPDVFPPREAAREHAWREELQSKAAQR